MVLLGDVGTGKSTIVEKLTGETVRASDSEESATSSSSCFLVPDGRLMICDTPGSNAMANTFMQNVWIAQAMNFQPVSKVLVVVKAGTRIDYVVEKVTEYADRFLDMDDDFMGVIVTHMDTVEWFSDACSRHLQERGIGNVLYTDRHLPGSALLDNILEICTSTYNIRVDHENFLKHFNLTIIVVNWLVFSPNDTRDAVNYDYYEEGIKKDC